MANYGLFRKKIPKIREFWPFFGFFWGRKKKLNFQHVHFLYKKWTRMFFRISLFFEKIFFGAKIRAKLPLFLRFLEISEKKVVHFLYKKWPFLTFDVTPPPFPR